MNYLNDKYIIFYDNHCPICNSWVNFIIKHDKKEIFNFSFLKSNFSKKNITPNKLIYLEKIDSVILLKKNKFYTQSSAVLHIVKELKSPFPILFLFIIIPKTVRDFLYKIIAKNRYKFKGRQKTCLPLNDILKKRFYD